MARKAVTNGGDDGEVLDYRHGQAKRKNNPPAGLAAQGRIAERPAARYSYDPHLPPTLRFDLTGAIDRLPELLDKARQRPLTAAEVETLAEALRRQEPWLEWSGKAEQQKRGLRVDDVPLHIHERVSTRAILAVAKRQTLMRDMFADPELEFHEAVKFYLHDVDWANRLILGDSLVVMNSLAKREDLAGKVQMIYVDPPYGINFRSNFQPTLGQRSVSDKPQDLTREAEVVKAYRDTWTLGVHSYLSYLRDRLVVAKELLADTGSAFVQISDENVHLLRNLLDEVFGNDNFIVMISLTKKGSQSGDFVPPVNEYVLWYAKDRQKALTKFHRLYTYRDPSDAEGFTYCELSTGEVVSISDARSRGLRPSEYRLFSSNALFSQKPGPNEAVILRGQRYPSGGNSWKIAPARLPHVHQAGRILFSDNRVRYKRYADDFAAVALHNVWDDLAGTTDKVYVVQTNTRIVERCMLMTTDPGDLVIDPTCGSGTTAYVAEQWGRRWITIDTSRVAIAITRQRLLTNGVYDYYRLRDAEAGPAKGLVYKTVPHVALKSIAQNTALDPIFAKHEPTLVERLAALNGSLANLPRETRAILVTKLIVKEKREGKRSITEADRRRWLLPKVRWNEWEVPFDSDPDWPTPMQEALADYRAAWRAKMDEVNACIASRAESEDLVDQPTIERGVTRVCGPFTVEAVLPPVASLDAGPSPVDEPDDDLPTFTPEGDPTNAAAFIERMRHLLFKDGVRFPDNQQMKFARLDAMTGSVLHAEGEWAAEEGEGEARRVAVAFGPQYGPVTARQVEECLRTANRLGYDDLVFAGLSFDAAAQATIQEGEFGHVTPHLAHIRPDVNLGGLLKETPNSQLFTVYGLPRTGLKQVSDGQWQVEMEGVDIYNPVDNSIQSTVADKVAAWFLDSDYDGRTFCICQAFFPDRSAWDKIARALGNKNVMDITAFDKFSGTVSLPFHPGKHGRVAVKVIDARGNEVLRVHSLIGEAVYA